MKRVLVFMTSILLFILAGAQTTEFLSTKDFQNEKKKLADGINSVKKTALDTKKTLSIQNQTLDSLSRQLSLYQAQLAKNNDSISNLNLKVGDLQEQMNQKKTSSRNQLIFAFGLILLLLILSFVFIYMIKKKSDQNFLALSEEIMSTNSKLELGLNKVSEDVGNCKEMINVSTNDLNQQLRNSMEHFEIRTGHIEQQIKDYTGIIEGKINKTKEENDLLLRKHEENLNSFQAQVDQKHKELTVLINSVENNQKGIAPGIIDNLSAFKTQVEDKIKSISSEISKFKMK